MKRKKAQYTRVLLKLSGEALVCHENAKLKCGVDLEAVTSIASQIDIIRKLHVQVGIVVGGGNIIRGSQSKALKVSSERADQMGMLATAINGMMLAEALERIGCPTLIVGAFPCGNFISEGNGVATIDFLENGIVVIFVGGVGQPYFTTDTAAALRACEIKADVLIKATKVDGLFDKDPLKYPQARKIDRIRYTDVLNKKLKIMDFTAVALCQEHKVPIHILNIFKEGALESAICKQSGGSFITGA